MRTKITGPLFVVALLGGCLPDYPADRLRTDPGRGESGDVSATNASHPSTATSSALAPEFGTTRRQADPPPPLSGGTMTVAPDGKTVVAADPDRDRVYIVDYHDASTLRTVALHLHDEPGRVVVDHANRAHVALRRGGALVTIDLATASVLARRNVCSAPRGLAYDAAADVVHVACAGGELVAFPAGGGAELRRRKLARDLRDVVVLPGALVVSTFRDAHTYRIEDGDTVAFERPRLGNADVGDAAVAWRMVALPPRSEGTPADPLGNENVLMAAQRVPAAGADVSVAPPPLPASYYTGWPQAGLPCSANGPGPLIVDGNTGYYVPDATLPVDVAASATFVAVVAAGNAHTPALPQLVFVHRNDARAAGPMSYRCYEGPPNLSVDGLQLTSVAFASEDTLLALSREPAALVVVHVDAATYGSEVSRILLASDSREDTGHAIFHSNSGVGVACASCHPDGRDDGHAWRSLELGARRTPSLLGTLAGTAPYHWNGEAADLAAVMQLTFQSRMHGPTLTGDQQGAIGAWLGALAAPPSVEPTDAAAAARGKALFEGSARCSTCHSGAMRTDNATLDIGTGGAFQVPSLVGVSWRAPFLHDGSAPTLRAVLERAHGGVVLDASQMSDVTAYVGTF